MSYFRDPDFQQNLVAFLCRDRNFLKRTSGLLSAEDFKPRKGGDPYLYYLAQIALKFYSDYGGPVGGLLRTEAYDFAKEHKLSDRQRSKLFDVVNEVKHNSHLVAVEALEEKVKKYKQRRALREAVQELAEMEESGSLNAARFRSITNEALDKADSGRVKIIDYLGTLPERQSRRRLTANITYPFLMIDELDTEIRTTRRGTLSMWLAKYKVGKSVAFAHLDIAYAMQGFNVLHFTLEDSGEDVEDRLDASVSAIPLRKLNDLPKRLRKRFNRMKEKIAGRIKIVDLSEGGATVARIRQIWEQERNRGFMADMVLIDYDDEIEPVGVYKGESAKRMGFAEIYRDLRRFAKQCDIWVWIAAQARRGKEDQMVIRGDDAAEDISKLRKVALCLGIGAGPKSWGNNSRHLFVAAHRHDKNKFGISIMGDFERAILYDREATARMILKERKEKARLKKDR